MQVKELDLSRINWQKALRLAAYALCAALLIALCINISMRSHIQNQYAKAREELTDSIYTELYMFCQTFDQISVPGVDVQNELIPQMKDHFLAARTLNAAAAKAFGDATALLSGEEETAVDAAFTQYDAAFKTGKATDSAQSAMLSCVQRIRAALEARYPAAEALAG